MLWRRETSGERAIGQERDLRIRLREPLASKQDMIFSESRKLQQDPGVLSCKPASHFRSIRKDFRSGVK